MKILLDEGLPRRVATLLRDLGTDAVHVTKIQDPGTADLAILEEARASGRILSASDVRDLVIRLVNDHEAALLSGAALSVRAHLVGIRKLPLTELPSEDPEPADEN